MEQENDRSVPLQMTIRDLQLIAKSTEDRYVMTIYQTAAGLWAIKVKFEEKELALAVETVRGGLKVWRNIRSAILFVQNNCKFASDIIIEIGDWTLVRMNPQRTEK